MASGSASTWSTSKAPEQDRFTAWEQKVSEVHLRWDLMPNPDDHYRAWLRHREVRGATIADCRCSPFAGTRPSLLAPSGHDDMVGIVFNLEGRMACQHGEEELVLEPGDLFVWDSRFARRFAILDTHRGINILVPRERVSRLLPRAERVAGTARPTRGSGIIAVARDGLVSLGRELNDLTDPELSVALAASLDVLGAALGPVTDTYQRSRAALLAAMRTYIVDHISDPGLSASSVALAHDVSVRTVHTAFAEAGASVAQWIREQRLQRAHSDLVHAGPGTTVTDVVFRWGFNDAAHFSRIFKERFGVPPSAVLPRRHTIPLAR